MSSCLSLSFSLIVILHSWLNKLIDSLYSHVCMCSRVRIGATTVGTGGDWSNNVIGPQLLSSSFQKARNFTVTRMKDLASEFSENFRVWYPRTLAAGGGDPLPHPTPSPAFVGAQTLVPLNFLAVVAPLRVRRYKQWRYCLLICHVRYDCSNRRFYDRISYT